MASVTTLIGLGMPPELANVVSDGVVAGNLNVSGTSTLTGAVTASAGIRTKMAINDVDNTTPTNANFEASFGTAAAVGSGFVGIVKDNDANSICYLVVSNGTSFFYLSMTKAL